MGNGCTSCCGKIQDWCRDACGCCPCKCCKTTNVDINLEVKEDKVISKKDIPYGFGRVYTGVRKVNNSYASPILELHTWRKQIKQSDTSVVTVSRRVALGGLQTARDNADTRVGPLRGTQHRQIEMDEEIQCIPIESIISIKYSGDIKKEQRKETHIIPRTPPPKMKLSCCGKVKNWCSVTFCCCCKDDNKVQPKPERTRTEIADEKGERVILMTIEYVRYSNIDTPSHFKALSTPDAHAYYKAKLDTDTVKFYLLSSQEFDSTDFELKRAQGAALCRLVTQLKTMGGQYPDEKTLQDIMNKHEAHAFGDPPKETLS